MKEVKIMKTKSTLLIVACVLIFSLAACSTPAAPTIDPNALGTIVAQNIQLTQLAATLTQVVAEQTAAVTNTSAVTNTPRPTPTETTTPTPLSGVWLTLDQPTNCRMGQSTSYPIAATVPAGTQIQALALSQDGEFFYVRYFDTSNHYCWLWKQTSYVTGNPGSLPMYTAVPTKEPSITPTSAASFSVSYESLQICSSKYSLRFNIKNTGYQTWQSIKIVIVDETEGVTVTHTANAFTAYTGCNAGQTQGDLTTNEPGLVSAYNPGEFSYDPTGHILTVTVSLYSEKGQAGTQVSRAIQVKP